ncbi:hypothetical protein V3H18_04790 [Methylocystis sp. 9N]|uniref:Uncharacterized protein n=1 Tax=Methylocystis borbori TaxID=3118750 RepID=A0ABU7XFQ8_9HYPH
MFKSLRLAFLLLLPALVAAAPEARAHRALDWRQEACVLKVGPDFMYLTGYQPATSRKTFCEDIPTAGDTIFVLDYAQEEMRAMTTDFRIVRNVGEAQEEERLDAVTVAYLPPHVYPAGTLEFEHVFKEGGDYVGIVTMDGPHGEHWVSRFPFTVGGRSFIARAPYVLLAAAAALALLLALAWGKRDESAPHA